MDYFINAGSAALTAIIGFELGRRSAALPGRWWSAGYWVAMAMVMIYATSLRAPACFMVKPIGWLLLGQKKFAAFGFVTALVLATPMQKLPQRRQRRAMKVLIVTFVSLLSIWPYLAPAFNQRQLAALRTNIDGDGVCLQGTGYTCGPAAAVTVLRKFGLPAEESQIALWAHSTSTTGTPPDILAATLEEHFSARGVTAHFRVFKDIAELRTALPALAVVKFNLFTDHYVAVLEISDTQVKVAEPLVGMVSEPLDDFVTRWRKSGVVVVATPFDSLPKIEGVVPSILWQ